MIAKRQASNFYTLGHKHQKQRFFKIGMTDVTNHHSIKFPTTTQKSVDLVYSHCLGHQLQYSITKQQLQETSAMADAIINSYGVLECLQSLFFLKQQLGSQMTIEQIFNDINSSAILFIYINKNFDKFSQFPFQHVKKLTNRTSLK